VKPLCTRCCQLLTGVGEGWAGCCAPVQNGAAAVHLAASSGHWDVAVKLLEAGANYDSNFEVSATC
jgi:hypothetical protein